MNKLSENVASVLVAGHAAFAHLSKAMTKESLFKAFR